MITSMIIKENIFKKKTTKKKRKSTVPFMIRKKKQKTVKKIQEEKEIVHGNFELKKNFKKCTTKEKDIIRYYQILIT